MRNGYYKHRVYWRSFLMIVLSTLFSQIFISNAGADKLAWDPVTAQGSYPVAGYKIHYGTSSGNYTYVKDVGNVTTYDLSILELKPGQAYYFVVAAYTTIEEEGFVSNAINGVPSTGNTSENVNGGCFIATAVFGSKRDQYVQILSEFRNKWLANNYLGQRFIAFYNKFSPPMVDFLHRHPCARAFMRYVLITITGVAYLALCIHPLALLFSLILLLLIGVYYTRRFYQSRSY